MSDPSMMMSLESMGIMFAIYLIPCLVGSAVSFIIKNNIATKGMRKRKLGKAIFFVFISSILPSILMCTLDILLSDKDVDERLLMLMAIFIGAAGDDLSHYVISKQGITAILKLIAKGSKSLSELSSKLIPEDKDDESDKK